MPLEYLGASRELCPKGLASFKPLGKINEVMPPQVEGIDDQARAPHGYGRQLLLGLKAELLDMLMPLSTPPHEVNDHHDPSQP